MCRPWLHCPGQLGSSTNPSSPAAVPSLLPAPNEREIGHPWCVGRSHGRERPGDAVGSVRLLAGQVGGVHGRTRRRSITDRTRARAVALRPDSPFGGRYGSWCARGGAARAISARGIRRSSVVHLMRPGGVLLTLMGAVAAVVSFFQPWRTCPYDDSSSACAMLPADAVVMTMAMWSVLIGVVITALGLFVRRRNVAR
jgi:hypothetical protein